MRRLLYRQQIESLNCYTHCVIKPMNFVVHRFVLDKIMHVCIVSNLPWAGHVIRNEVEDKKFELYLRILNETELKMPVLLRLQFE